MRKLRKQNSLATDKVSYDKDKMAGEKTPNPFNAIL